MKEKTAIETLGYWLNEVPQGEIGWYTVLEDFGKRIDALEAKELDPAPADERGLYGKYRILKADTGKPVEGDYFVLKLTDVHARAALAAYADSCEAENSELATDLRKCIAGYGYEPAPAPEISINPASYAKAMAVLRNLRFDVQDQPGMRSVEVVAEIDVAMRLLSGDQSNVEAQS